MSELKKISMTLPNVPDIESIAVEGLKHVGNHLGVDESKLNEASIITSEAVINALEHSGTGEKGVYVEFAFFKSELVIYIKDQGKGFDANNVQKPDILEKIGSDHKRGWGLNLMKSMADRFEIESDKETGGTTITMKLNL